MVKLSPDVKYGCPKCRNDLDIMISEIEELSFLLDGSDPPMKQLTLTLPKKPKSNKVVSLF